MKNRFLQFCIALLVVLFFSCSTSSEGSNENSSSNITRPINPITALEIRIGGQIWSAKNLNVSKYSDGTPILQVTDPTQWASLTTGAWCYYENSTTNGATYGKLYNWYAVAGIFDAASADNPALRKKLAPNGWHIPTDSEWTQLINYLGGEALACGKMKSVGTTLWQAPNASATNSSGFSGLPGGWCGDGTFGDVGLTGSWWSSTEFSKALAWRILLSFDSGWTYRGLNHESYGISVRCLRD